VVFPGGYRDITSNKVTTALSDYYLPFILTYNHDHCDSNSIVKVTQDQQPSYCMRFRYGKKTKLFNIFSLADELEEQLFLAYYVKGLYSVSLQDHFALLSNCCDTKLKEKQMTASLQVRHCSS
jgi:hypothetical protein